MNSSGGNIIMHPDPVTGTGFYFDGGIVMASVIMACNGAIIMVWL